MYHAPHREQPAFSMLRNIGAGIGIIAILIGIRLADFLLEHDSKRIEWLIVVILIALLITLLVYLLGRRLLPDADPYSVTDTRT